MEVGEEKLVMPTERLRKHTGSVVTEYAGELVFTFNNEFSWLTNKKIALTVGQWASKTRSDDAGAGVAIAPITPHKSGSTAVALLKAAKAKARAKAKAGKGSSLETDGSAQSQDGSRQVHSEETGLLQGDDGEDSDD
eukprot:SAG31_NODE_2079_length_6498_cov_3.416159_4_plen_137_part_00